MEDLFPLPPPDPPLGFWTIPSTACPLAAPSAMFLWTSAEELFPLPPPEPPLGFRSIPSVACPLAAPSALLWSITEGLFPFPPPEPPLGFGAVPSLAWPLAAPSLMLLSALPGEPLSCDLTMPSVAWPFAAPSATFLVSAVPAFEPCGSGAACADAVQSSCDDLFFSPGVELCANSGLAVTSERSNDGKSQRAERGTRMR